MSVSTSRLTLGTAQLGMPYGIANVTGQPGRAAVTEIIATAWAVGVRCFDTAQAYGDSETVLGLALARLGVAGEAHIITKLSPSVDAGNVSAILDSLRASLARLGVERIWGVMLHREDHLHQWDKGIGEAFARAKQEGLIVHAGVSVYSPDYAWRALQQEGLSVLQVPANIFDRRMLRTGVLAEAARRGTQVFVRSVYLQGLILLPVTCVAQTAPFAVTAVAAAESFCRARGIGRQEFALRYALALDPFVRLVVGAETREQVAENAHLIEMAPLPSVLCQEWDASWPDDPELLVDPSQWPIKPREKPAQ